MVNMHNAQSQASPPLSRDRLGDFQHTKPPTFSDSVPSVTTAVEGCNNQEKVLLASHQLIRHAGDWWDAYVEAHEESDTINWKEFKMAFWSHHVPQGVIKLMKMEFQDLKQGSKMVSEYVTPFAQLSCYTPNDVDTNEKKQVFPQQFG
jgi:hypothetical protein